MSDDGKDPIGVLIRESYQMWGRLWYCITETTHAWTNIWTEYARSSGLPTPQGIGKFFAIGIPVALFAAVVAAMAMNCL